MRLICLTSIAVFGLAATTAFADGAGRDTGSREPSAALTPAARALIDDFEFASRIRLSDDPPALRYDDALARPLVRFELRRLKAAERPGEMRRLSLITFSELGKAEFFFGIDSDGTLGLHFGATSRKKRAAEDRPVPLPELRPGVGL